jgi:hypothetical protein
LVGDGLPEIRNICHDPCEVDLNRHSLSNRYLSLLGDFPPGIERVHPIFGGRGADSYPAVVLCTGRSGHRLIGPRSTPSCPGRPVAAPATSSTPRASRSKLAFRGRCGDRLLYGVEKRDLASLCLESHVQVPRFPPQIRIIRCRVIFDTTMSWFDEALGLHRTTCRYRVSDNV